MSLISDNLVFLRKSRGLKQKDIALGIGIKPTAYSNYETGTSLPDVPTLVKISKYFGITLDDLLTKTLAQNVSVLVNEPEASYSKDKDQYIIKLQEEVIRLMREVSDLRSRLPVSEQPIVSTTPVKNAG